MTADRLPDEIERDLTLVHADVCGCTVANQDPRYLLVCRACEEVRSTLRRAIWVVLDETRADYIVAYWDADNRQEVIDRLRARAKAIREGRWPLTSRTT